MDLVDCSLIGFDCEFIGDVLEYHNLIESFFGSNIFSFIMVLFPPFFLACFYELNLQGIVCHFLPSNFEVNCVVLLFQIGVPDHIVVGVYLIINQIFTSRVAVESFSFNFTRNFNNMDSNLFHIFVSVSVEVVFRLVDFYSVFFYLFLFQIGIVTYVREADCVLLLGQGIVEYDYTQFEYFHIFFLYFLEERGCELESVDQNSTSVNESGVLFQRADFIEIVTGSFLFFG